MCCGQSELIESAPNADPPKAEQIAKGEPVTVTLPAIRGVELVREMVEGDYVAAKRDSLVKQAGYQAFDWHE